MDGQRRCLSLAKGHHRYVFTYHEGRESELLASFVDLAERPDADFDWYDAAVLSFQMGKGIGFPQGRRSGVSHSRRAIEMG